VLKAELRRYCTAATSGAYLSNMATSRLFAAPLSAEKSSAVQSQSQNQNGKWSPGGKANRLQCHLAKSQHALRFDL